MDQTQSYLNSILKKRLGSVVNYGGNSKTAQTVTRIPKQQQKIETMPTVFRKKHETVYIQNQSQGTYYSQAQSEYLSMKQGTKGPQSNNGQEVPEQNRQTSNQRVEYMLISKRIQSKKEDEFISPTVDVTNYSKARKSEEIKHHNTDNEHDYKSNIYTGSSKHIAQSERQEFHSQKPRKNEQQNQSDPSEYALGSKISMNTDKSKRKRIFGQ